MIYRFVRATPLGEVSQVRRTLNSDERPELRWVGSERQPGMPTKPVVTMRLRQLCDVGILKQPRPSSGRRAQVPALAQLVNLCEGRRVV